jgi:hypothetical protein
VQKIADIASRFANLLAENLVPLAPCCGQVFCRWRPGVVSALFSGNCVFNKAASGLEQRMLQQATEETVARYVVAESSGEC